MIFFLTCTISVSELDSNTETENALEHLNKKISSTLKTSILKNASIGIQVISLKSGEVVDPAIPVHAALVPQIEVVDKSLPFSLDISVINILMIVFTVWVVYTCALPSPRDFTMPDED